MTTPVSVVLVSASNAVGATTRERCDVKSLTPPAEGGLLVLRVRNGATGPTVQCVCQIMIARKQSSMPATGAEGADGDGWIKVAEFGGGTVANAVTPWSYRFGPEVAYIQVEFAGNTGQAVGVDAVLHAYG